MAAATQTTKEMKDAMVIDAIDHLALCIADSLNGLPEEERDKQRLELVKMFAEGLLIKSKNAETLHKVPAKASINLYMSYIRPSAETRDTHRGTISIEHPVISEEEKIKIFREKLAESEQKKASIY